MKRLIGVPLALAALAVLFVAFGGGQALSGGAQGQFVKNAATGKLKPAQIKMTKNGKTVTRTLPFLSDATIQTAQDALNFKDERLEAADATAEIPDSEFSDIGGAQQTLGCSKRDSKSNTRVNQDCSFRRQAEEIITYDPTDTKNIVAGQNDSRVGYNQCGIDYSLNDAKSFGDLLPPFRQRTNHPEKMGPVAGNPNNNTIIGGVGTGHTYDAGSDPANAMDSSGRAYFSCVTFDVASNASGLYVTQAPQGADGAFYYNIPDAPNKRFMVVEDNSFVFHDKNFIAADRYSPASSPRHDNVYVTWTVFFADPDTGATQQSPIYGSMSTDQGVTWSTPQQISGTSETLCFFGNLFNPKLPEHSCNFDQGSDPVVLPNGDLEVIFNNGNTPAGNPNGQQLGVHCAPSGSSSAGTAQLHCVAPVKVGEDILVGEPQCDFGRGPEECIPGAWIRTNDYPRITQDNTQNNHLYAVWQDYRSGEYDIQMSISTNGGLSWTEVGQVNPDTALDHYFAATDQSPKKSDRVGVSYYRTARVPNENGSIGCHYPDDPTTCTPFTPGVQAGVGARDSDYVLSGGTGIGVPYDFKVVSPVFPPPDGIQAGFNGDYSGLTIPKNEDAHPIWSDTRNVNPFPLNGVTHDEDIFTDKANLPSGKAKTGPGTIGKG